MNENTQKQIARLATLKLKPYSKFIKRLLAVEDQGIVLEKDYRELRAIFQGKVMLHLEKEHAQKIMAHLISIGRCVGLGSENSRLGEELRTPVLAAVNILMRNLGLGGELDEAAIVEMETAEDAFFPRLFRQAIKEALDNVLVNYSDYNLFNRGDYVRKEDGEYIIYSFINYHPRGCQLMIGPFGDGEILFQLYVPRYIPEALPEFDANTMRLSCGKIDSFVQMCVEHREMPLSLSRPLADSCLIELEQEDCYNDYIPSFAFEDRPGGAFYHRRNYAEIAFALGQRAKYILLNAHLAIEGMSLQTYIRRLKKIDPFALYPSVPWRITDDGDLVYVV